MSLSLFLCLLSFGLCYWTGRRSLVNGLAAVLAVGYVYGIIRANVPETFSHFIFDAGVLGLYAAQLFRRLTPLEQFKIEPIRPWLDFLIVWPLLVFLVPIQEFLVQLVGLRGNVFLLPLIFIGARLGTDERYRLALGIAGMNVLVFIVAGAEYLYGLQKFYPLNAVTAIVYISKDVVGHTQYRIPASFVNAHAYAGTMVMGLPLLLGAFMRKKKGSLHTQLLILGIATALLGVLMSAARTHFLVAGVLIIVATFSLRSRMGYALGWLVLLVSIGWVVSSQERLQRFTELKDTDAVVERVGWSVNMNFFEIAAQYPFGNGLGGGGSSIPYFLQDRIKDRVVMENEYARIMLEQGIIGLGIWICFIVWLLKRWNNNPNDPSYLGRRLAWVACAVYFAIAVTGTGLMTSIPQSFLFFLLIGWVGERQTASDAVKTAQRDVIESAVSAPRRGYAHLLQ